MDAISYLDEMRNAVKSPARGGENCCAPETRAAVIRLGPKEEAQLADLCRALGHPARVTILRVLLEKDACIAGKLADLVPLAASTVSQHLKILKDSGLIKGEIDGPRRCYCADKALYARFQALLDALRPSESRTSSPTR